MTADQPIPLAAPIVDVEAFRSACPSQSSVTPLEAMVIEFPVVTLTAKSLARQYLPGALIVAGMVVIVVQLCAMAGATWKAASSAMKTRRIFVDPPEDSLCCARRTFPGQSRSGCARPIQCGRTRGRDLGGCTEVPDLLPVQQCQPDCPAIAPEPPSIATPAWSATCDVL